MIPGALVTQSEISNITAIGSKCSVTQRWLIQLATVMRSGALLAQDQTSNITASGIERSAEVRFKTWSYPLRVEESATPRVGDTQSH